jgi:hypothetical protein
MRTIVVTQAAVGSSAPAILDYYGGPDVALQVDILSGTPNWTVQQTLQNPNDASVTPVWYDHSDTNMVAQTVGRQSNYAFAPMAVRVNVNEASSGAVRLTVLQNGPPGLR